MPQKNHKYLYLGLFYSLLTLLLLAIIAKFGFLAAVKISELIQNQSAPLLPSTNIAESIIPPPRLFSLLQATNSAELPIEGIAQPNQKVELFLNDSSVSLIDSDSEGKFARKIQLSLGNNSIYARAQNNEGVKSQNSQIFTVFYSNSPPLLEISEPEDKKTIKKNSKVNIKGKVDQFSKIMINNHLVIHDESGNFTYQVSLNEGENKVFITSIDPAQNKTEKELTLFFVP